MARYTKADAARHLGISRTTLYKLIDQGKVSPTPEGLIDDTELVRVAPFVDTLKERTRTPIDNIPMDTHTSHDGHRIQSVDTANEHQWTDAHARQQTSSDAQLTFLREQLALAQEREKDQERRHEAREQAYQEQIAWLRLQIDQTHVRYERLLAAPPALPTAPGTDSPRDSTPSPAADRGAMRRRIVALVQEHPDGLSPSQARRLLGVDKSLVHTMAAMARDGLLRRVEAGRYTV